MKIYITVFYLISGVYSLDEAPADMYLSSPNSEDLRVLLDNKTVNDIDFQQQTVVLVHGWFENGTITYYYNIAKEYQMKDKYNIIFVDWKRIADENYIFAWANVERIGRYIANYLIQLYDMGLDFGKVHVIGHSMGAHIAGFIGKEIKNETGEQLHRITALDPAGALYGTYISLENPNKRLAKDDAEMVLILHTSIKWGIVQAFGTIDFYANDGLGVAPGCEMKDPRQLLNWRFYFCSHQHSWNYYIESINSDAFIATNCERTLMDVCKNGTAIIFGDDTPFGATGIYYFDTNPDPPYAKGTSS